MGLPAAASATRRNSRQTDFKGPPLQRIARFCHALLLLSVTGKQRSRCSGMASVLNLLVTDTGTRQFSICLSSARARRRRPDLHWEPHRACGKASSGRISPDVVSTASVPADGRGAIGISLPETMAGAVE